MKTHIIRATEDLETLRESIVSPEVSARQEAELLRPVFKAWGKRLQPHHRGEDISERLIKDFVKVAEFTGSFLASDHLIVTSRELSNYCQKLQTKQQCNNIMSNTNRKPLKGPYGYVLDITHSIQYAYHSFGFWQLPITDNQTQTFSFLAVHAQFLFDRFQNDELQNLMDALGKVFFYTNHDPLHHLTTLDLNDNNISGASQSDHQGQFRQAVDFTKNLRRESAIQSDKVNYIEYETWANVSYRLTFFEMMRDQNFVEQIKSNIRDYFQVLDAVHARLLKDDPDNADYTYNYFFDLMAFSFVRIFPDIHNEICQTIAQCSEGKESIIGPFLKSQTNILDSDTLQSIKTGFGLFANDNKPESENQKILAKKWRYYMRLDAFITDSHKYSGNDRIIALHDILRLETSRKMSQKSQEISELQLAHEHSEL